MTIKETFYHGTSDKEAIHIANFGLFADTFFTNQKERAMLYSTGGLIVCHSELTFKSRYQYFRYKHLKRRGVFVDICLSGYRKMQIIITRGNID